MKQQFLDLNGLTELVTYLKKSITEQKEILPYASNKLFPSTGNVNTIYIDTATNIIYRWDSSNKKYEILAKAVKSVSISESTENGKITLTVDGNKTTVPIHGLGSAAYTNSSAYSPAGHTHTKAQVGLGNVDNTADANKSVKHATTADSATTAGTATNVSATQGADDAARHVWFSDSATETKRAYSDKFKYNPVTNNLTVNVTGNAATASSVAWGNVTGKPSTYAPSAHNHDDSTITSLNASKLFGTIDIARLPHGALERCVIVEDDTARFALTTAKIQLGDTVKVNKTQKMYFVIDDSKLNSEAGYTVYTAGSAASVPWSGVTGKPSTYTPSVHSHKMTDISDWGSYIYDVHASRTANTVLAAPNGSNGSATFRKLVAADIPSITKSKISDFPSSLPASDVYAWAKASTKPSYTKAEVGLGSVDNTADSAKSVKYATSAGSANAVVWANVSGKPSITGKQTRTLTASGPSGWKDAATDQGFVPDMAFMAYWNGAYSGSSSNLAYCNRGAFGTIVTKNAGDYATASHTHHYAGSSSAGGNANAAVKLATARKIGNASFDGTANITLSQMGLNVPVEVTKADYLAKKKAGTLNANTYYNVIDEYDSANVINDSSVTANSAFSSTKSEKTYAKKSAIINTTLTASKWTGSSAPYTYVLPVSGATTSNIVEINYASNASSQAIEAYQNAMLADGGQTTNQITIKATEKPTVDIPITIVIRNDL